MPLQDLQKDLQKKESTSFEREHDKTAYDVWNSKGVQKNDKGFWDNVKDNMKDKKKKAVIIGSTVVFCILILMLIGGLVMHFQKGFFAQDRVMLFVQSPKTINSNAVTEIVFEYNNNNRAFLHNAEIAVDFGGYFIPSENQEAIVMASKDRGIIKIGEIMGKEVDKVAIVGYFVGPVNSMDTIRGTLKYSPEKTDVIYQITGNATTTIASSPLSIDVKLPQEIVSGNLINTNIVVRNNSNNDMSNLKLSINADDGFNIHKTNPVSSVDNVWLIDEIKKNSEYIVEIQGNLEANIGTVQTFAVEVGTQEGKSDYVVYANERISPKIVKSPIEIKQSVNGGQKNSVQAGELLKYSINFHNNSKIPLRDAIVSLKFDTNMLDFSNLNLQGLGDYDEVKREIRWKASDIAELKILKPNDSGVITFSVPVLSNFPIDSVHDKNFSIVTLSAIDSDDMPSELRANKTVLSNLLAIPVSAKTVFNSEKEYFQGKEMPTVGEKTVYKINFSIDSINNKIIDTIVKTALPTYVKFEKGNKDVEFNERTNEIIWNAGDVQNGAGVTSTKRETTFLISIVPSVEQLDSSPALIKEQYFSATDSFTNIDISKVGEEITTRNKGSEVNTGKVVE